MSAELITIKISRGALEASWDAVADEHLPAFYRDVIVRARRNGILIGTRDQLLDIADDLGALGEGWLLDKGVDLRSDARKMVRAAATIRTKLELRDLVRQ